MSILIEIQTFKSEKKLENVVHKDSFPNLIFLRGLFVTLSKKSHQTRLKTHEE